MASLLRGREQSMTEIKEVEQSITYDDFEQSLKHDGIEIIVPEVEAPQRGIGSAGYKPRKTAPSYDNRYYLKRGMGGYNRCILISGNSCLANCVGYAYGRCLENGSREDTRVLPTCNAEDWLSVARGNGLQTGNTPKLGAVIVWQSGRLWNSGDGCGHVGVVEEIYSDGSILVSQSNYGGTRFFLTTIKKPYHITGQTFIGFIYNPFLKAEPHWEKNSAGWWYDNGDGTYPANCWKFIEGKWYYFDSNGYMKTGWIEYKNGWYYCAENGAMVTGWCKIKEKWYFFDDNGLMQTGWIHWKNNWYYCGDSGDMFIGEHPVLAYFNADGALERKKS